MREPSQPLEHLQAVDLGHLEVQQDECRQARFALRGGPGREQVIKRLGAIARHDNLIGEPVALERAQG